MIHREGYVMRAWPAPPQVEVDVVSGLPLPPLDSRTGGWSCCVVCSLVDDPLQRCAGCPRSAPEKVYAVADAEGGSRPRRRIPWVRGRWRK